MHRRTTVPLLLVGVLVMLVSVTGCGASTTTTTAASPSGNEYRRIGRRERRRKGALRRQLRPVPRRRRHRPERPQPCPARTDADPRPHHGPGHRRRHADARFRQPTLGRRDRLSGQVRPRRARVARLSGPATTHTSPGGTTMRRIVLPLAADLPARDHGRSRRLRFDAHDHDRGAHDRDRQRRHRPPAPRPHPPPPRPRPPPRPTTSATPDSEGKTLFEASCSGCHGANGEGGVGPGLAGISEADAVIVIVNERQRRACRRSKTSSPPLRSRPSPST